MRTFTYSLILISFSLTPLAWSNSASPTSFTIKNKTHTFLHFPKLHLTISSNCGENPEKMRCQAAKSLHSASLKTIPRRDRHSRNPGSVVCTEVLQAEVVIGTDSQRNENSFCLFSDGSLIDNGTLAYYAIKHDSQ